MLEDDSDSERIQQEASTAVSGDTKFKSIFASIMESDEDSFDEKEHQEEEEMDPIQIRSMLDFNQDRNKPHNMFYR